MLLWRTKLARILPRPVAGHAIDFVMLLSITIPWTLAGVAAIGGAATTQLITCSHGKTITIRPAK